MKIKTYTIDHDSFIKPDYLPDLLRPIFGEQLADCESIADIPIFFGLNPNTDTDDGSDYNIFIINKRTMQCVTGCSYIHLHTEQSSLLVPEFSSATDDDFICINITELIDSLYISIMY